MSVAAQTVRRSGEAGEVRPELWRVEAAWAGVREASPLLRSQDRHPGRWRRFYDRVGPLWRELSGHGGDYGPALARRIFDLGLARPGDEVLEVGAGPGDLALELAAGGCRVTALDDSPAMTGCLGREALRRGLGMRCRREDWRGHSRSAAHDLAAAAFFPPALCPEGLLCLEGLSRGRALLALGVGGEVFPFRTRLLRETLGTLPQGGPGHLELARDWLLAAGRRPRVDRVSWEVGLDLPLAEVEEYFLAYLGIFYPEEEETRARIGRALAPFVRQGRVRAQGRAEAALLWWDVPKFRATAAAG